MAACRCAQDPKLTKGIFDVLSGGEKNLTLYMNEDLSSMFNPTKEIVNIDKHLTASSNVQFGWTKTTSEGTLELGPEINLKINGGSNNSFLWYDYTEGGGFQEVNNKSTTSTSDQPIAK